MRIRNAARNASPGARSRRPRPLVSATVGLVLKLIESWFEKVGEFAAALLGTAWAAATYFVVVGRRHPGREEQVYTRPDEHVESEETDSGANADPA